MMFLLVGILHQSFVIKADSDSYEESTCGTKDTDYSGGDIECSTDTELTNGYIRIRVMNTSKLVKLKICSGGGGSKNCAYFDVMNSSTKITRADFYIARDGNSVKLDGKYVAATTVLYRSYNSSWSGWSNLGTWASNSTFLNNLPTYQANGFNIQYLDYDRKSGGGQGKLQNWVRVMAPSYYFAQ